MIKLFCILLLTALSSVTQAETVYVTDNLRVNLRETDSKDSPVVDVVSSGMLLTVLETTPNGYQKVQMENGSVGYLLARFTTTQPTTLWRLREANEEIALLQNTVEQLKQQMDDVLGNQANPEDADPDAVAKRRSRLIREIMELRQLSSNTLEIKQQRDQLQERVVNTERELQQLKREKQTLENSSNQEWFLYGGILAFTGIFLGVLLPKLSGERKSDWNSF